MAGLGRFEGKVALITGGGTGIGTAVAARLTAEGARVVLTGRREAPLAAAAAALGALHFAADAADAGDMRALLAYARAEAGGVDILVANAGAHGFGTITETSDEDWAASIRGNLNTAFVVVRELLPELLARRGNIVVVSSLAGLFAGPEAAGYVTMKHALLGLVKVLTRDYGPRGLRANAVCPGWVTTPMADAEMEVLRERHGLADIAAAYQLAARHVPLRRPATPAEVASVIAFLASEDAAMVAGVALPVDGGASVVDLPTIGFAD